MTSDNFVFEALERNEGFQRVMATLRAHHEASKENILDLVERDEIYGAVCAAAAERKFLRLIENVIAQAKEPEENNGNIEAGD